MDIQAVLTQLDTLFSQKKHEQVEGYLTSSLEQALKENDDSSVVTLLNELIGFYRDSGLHTKSMAYGKHLMALLKKMGLEGTIPYATSLLNVANACRAAGELDASLSYYQTVESIYHSQLEKNDFRFASLYNNMSLLYQEKKDYKKSCICLTAALSIVKQYPQAKIELATTHANLAASFLELDDLKQAQVHLMEAGAIFEQDEEKDYHYSALLSTWGDLHARNENWKEALLFYDRARKELESHMGQTENYAIICEKMARVLEKTADLPAASSLLETAAKIRQNLLKNHFSSRQEIAKPSIINGLTLSRLYYETYGKKMIHEQFPEYESRIAVGLLGEGSQCFGFDDEYSQDHDFGPCFCMFLTDEDYNAIGQQLQEAYDNLPDTLNGYTRPYTPLFVKRYRVHTISGFVEHFTGMDQLPQTSKEWLSIPPSSIACLVNGEIFRDDLGTLTRIRQYFQSYYPDPLWYRLIAQCAGQMAQAGQYNYNRQMRRGEYVSARLALGEFMKQTMQMVYLLNRKYPPYEKWMHQGIKTMPILPQIYGILNALTDMPNQKEAWQNLTEEEADGINGKDQTALTIEVVCSLVSQEMHQRNLTCTKTPYLENHAKELVEKSDQMLNQKQEDSPVSEDSPLLSSVIRTEWDFFDQVKNEGGRASCQDDWDTFEIMRKSQFLTWPQSLLYSYGNDLLMSRMNHWNPVMEKYAWMMESTSPKKYQEIKDSLPPISPQKEKMIGEIIPVQVAWMEEFHKKYPHLGMQTRLIHTHEDTQEETSFETYLRGELKTYSESTLTLYHEWIFHLVGEGKNLTHMTMEHTIRLYGYSSLEDAERKQSNI